MSMKWKQHFPDISKVERKVVNAEKRNTEGEIIFQQKDVEVPANFSQRAADIVASQYFRGKEGTPQREKSFFQVVGRVVGKLREWAEENEYFATNEDLNAWASDLTYILLTQRAAFNSPVWYNLGVKGQRQQGAACFIGDVDDDMESIGERIKIEQRVFKWGSGFGANSSKLRASHEPLSTGGIASGPVSFMRVLDANAEVVRSAGVRRASKMELLDADHPDIEEFIKCKAYYEDIARVIKDTLNLNTINDTGVPHQNANHSVVVNDQFMSAVVNDLSWQLIDRQGKPEKKSMCGREGKISKEVKARDLFNLIVECAHKCGDPGLLFETTINRWNPVLNCWGKIRACNPCSEFIQPSWSACNLASMNLLKFFDFDFDVSFLASDFMVSVRCLIIALDLIAVNSDYPDPRMAVNSKKYRPLGLGYTNLGALFVKMGVPYDSPRARCIATAITAMMSGHAWTTSAEIKRDTMGEEDVIPREDVLKVLELRMHYISNIDGTGIKGLRRNDVQAVWELAQERIEDFGVCNSQTTLLAPTGTISFLMDAETTGIEPLPMLGGVKKMSDKGVFHFTLPKCVQDFLSHDMDDDNIVVDDGRGNLKWNTYPEWVEEIKNSCVLDTAMGGMEMGTIHTDGHINMMVAVQPFLCGAISKTVNMPNSATSEDVYNVYISAWEKGLKSISIYRDGSKFEQPLNLTDKEEETEEESTPINGLRIKLPKDRPAVIHKFQIGEHKGYITTGFYPDGSPGEVFINMAKQGSTVRGLLDWGAVLVSMCLQYGVPLEDLVEKFKGVKFEPQGMTSNSKILFAQSPVDYIFRYLESTFLQDEVEGEEEEPYEELEPSGEPCAQCGSIMLRRGNCYYCDNCDISTGCS